MKIPKITLSTIALAGTAAYFLVPKLLRELDKTQAFISQKITKFKQDGITFDNGTLKAKFITSLEIANKNNIGFPIKDLGVKLYFKNKAGQLVEVAHSIPNFQAYLIPGAKNTLPGLAKIENIELLVDPKQVPGLLTSLFQFSKGIEFQVQSDLTVYGIKVSTSTPYKL